MCVRSCASVCVSMGVCESWGVGVFGKAGIGLFLNIAALLWL